MPKMPESEKKEEESAESREERKEQVVDECRVYCDHGGTYLYFVIIQLILDSSFFPRVSFSCLSFIIQERLKAAEAKRIEKERTEKYNKMKTDAKDARAKYREKYNLPESPPRSDAEEEEESEDEDDAFGAKPKVEQDPVEREL